MAGTRYESSLPGAAVVTITQEDRDRLHRPVGGEPDDSIRALMETDFRLQAELNELKDTALVRLRDIDHLGERVTDLSGRLDAAEPSIDALEDNLGPGGETLLTRVRALEEKVVALEVSQSPRADHPYNFKALQEFAWAAGTVIVTVLLQALADVEKVTDWKTWAVGVGVACLRAVLGLILAQGHVSSGVEPTSHVPTSDGARHS